MTGASGWQWSPATTTWRRMVLSAGATACPRRGHTSAYSAGQATVTAERVGRRQYKRLEIDAGTGDEAAWRKALEDAGDPEAVCDVLMTGVVPVERVVNPAAVEREYADRFFRLRVQSKVHLWLDDEQLGRLPNDSVLGRFVRLMHARLAEASEAQRPTLEEALQVGVALLQGREVLS